MPGAIELELDEIIKSIPDPEDIKPDKSGGEGGKTPAAKIVTDDTDDKGGRAISAEDLAELQKELQAAKDDAARERQRAVAHPSCRIPHRQKNRGGRGQSQRH